MSDSVEVSGPDIESTIAQALAKLGVTRDQVHVEVLEEPARRLLGLGVRPARVRVTVKDGVVSMPPPPPLAPVSVPEAVTPAPSVPLPPIPPAAPHDPGHAAPVKVVDPAEAVSTPDDAAASAPASAPNPAMRPPQGRAKQRPERAEQPSPPTQHDQSDRAFTETDDDHSPHPITLTDDQSNREVQVGTEIVQKLMGYMGITASVKARRAEAVDSKDTRHWVLEISGEELGMLIGNKGETLGALQYLTRLIAARTLGHRVNLVVDVAGYKSHREDMLRRLAKRMAAQVIDTNRSVSLEPMPPHERRIIHMTLRDHPSVKTESVGEGDKRKVMILLRRD